MSHSAAHQNGQGSSEDLLQDAYGFRLNTCTAQQLETRQRCDQAAEQVAPKWEKLKGRVQGKPDVVKDAKLKKYCRLVRLTRSNLQCDTAHWPHFAAACH